MDYILWADDAPAARFTSDIDVEVVSVNASDALVAASARVSTLGAESSVPGSDTGLNGLINFLMKNRHGSPFEHNQFIFKVTGPIFMWREHMRHRVGFSYNEESGRYKKLEAVFYTPDTDRPLVQVGKTGAYDFEPGNGEQRELVADSIEIAATTAYRCYEEMLAAGVAREVARMVLPVNIFSTAYVTCNARSLMHFLSLRTKVQGSMFPSFPQREIEIVASKYEAALAKAMPLTWGAFHDNGRVAP